MTELNDHLLRCILEELIAINGKLDALTAAGGVKVRGVRADKLDRNGGQRDE